MSDPDRDARIARGLVALRAVASVTTCSEMAEAVQLFDILERNALTRGLIDEAAGWSQIAAPVRARYQEACEFVMCMSAGLAPLIDGTSAFGLP